MLQTYAVRVRCRRSEGSEKEEEETPVHAQFIKGGLNILILNWLLI
jgi:hypothetical protein|tara:strand:+ start:1889 stop:2026 length:138 start_codon:yes stop_codon:yes gene_type:complete